MAANAAALSGADSTSAVDPRQCGDAAAPAGPPQRPYRPGPRHFSCKPGVVRRFSFGDGYTHELTPGEWRHYSDAAHIGIFRCTARAGSDGENSYRSFCGAYHRVFAVIRRGRRRAMLGIDLRTARLVLPRSALFEVIGWAEARGIEDHNIESDTFRLSGVRNEEAPNLMRDLLREVMERAVRFYEGEPILSPGADAHA